MFKWGKSYENIQKNQKQAYFRLIEYNKASKFCFYIQF